MTFAYSYDDIPEILVESQSNSQSILPAIEVLGLKVCDATPDAAVDWIMSRVRQRLPTHLTFLNAHCANIAARNPDYRACLQRADAIFPDGSGIALAARLKGHQLAANLNGTDLAPMICDRLVRSKQTLFLLGGGEGVAASAAHALQQRHPGLRIVGARDGYFRPDEEDGIVSQINESGADVLMVAMGVPRQELWIDRLAPRLKPSLLMGVGGLFDFMSGRIPRAPALLRKTGMEWTYRLYQEPRRMWRRYVLGNPAFVLRAGRAAAISRGARKLAKADHSMKRIIDVAVSGMGLLLLSPVFVLIMAAIRMESAGNPIFTQTRVGKDGGLFKMYKFRSMYRDAESRMAELAKLNHHGADGVTFKMKDDPRITKLGRLLRRSSMDELPQLLNVLNGTMSLVGPRPPLPAEVMRYSEAERRRLAGKPGITCIWQVSGRANLPFARQVELDVQYLKHRNIFKDFGIIVRTVRAVLTARGAY